jgi:importin-5
VSEIVHILVVLETDASYRSNPAVTQRAAVVFQHIVQALEAEMIQGQIANKVVASAKQLVAQTGINAEQILQTLTPEGQAAVKIYFQ